MCYIFVLKLLCTSCDETYVVLGCLGEAQSRYIAWNCKEHHANASELCRASRKRVITAESIKTTLNTPLTFEGNFGMLQQLAWFGRDTIKFYLARFF